MNNKHFGKIYVYMYNMYHITSLHITTRENLRTFIEDCNGYIFYFLLFIGRIDISNYKNITMSESEMEME